MLPVCTSSEVKLLVHCDSPNCSDSVVCKWPCARCRPACYRANCIIVWLYPHLTQIISSAPHQCSAQSSRIRHTMTGLLELPLEIRLQIREYVYTNNTFHIARRRNARSTRLPQPRYCMLSTRCNFEAEGAAGGEAAHNCSHPQQITWSRGLWSPLHINRLLRREIEAIIHQTLKVVFFGSHDIGLFQDSLEKHSVSLYARVRRVRKHVEAVYSNGRERAFSRLEAAVGGSSRWSI